MTGNILIGIIHMEAELKDMIIGYTKMKAAQWDISIIARANVRLVLMGALLAQVLTGAFRASRTILTWRAMTSATVSLTAPEDSS